MKKAIPLAALLLTAALTPAPPTLAQTPPTLVQTPPPPPAHVIKPEKRALITELFTAMEADKMAQQVADVMLGQMEPHLMRALAQSIPDGARLSAAEREQFQQRMAESTTRIWRRLRELLPQRVRFSEVMEQIFFPLYDKHFTETELKELVAFYKSPTGKKFISVVPQLTQESMTKTGELVMPKLSALVNELVEEELKSLKKP
jgi:uncharacterized protein